MYYNRLAIFTWVLFLSLSSCFAFELTPLSITIEPQGRNASAYIQVKNLHNYSKAIQVNMYTREPDLYDEEANEEAEDDFLVYPPQFILPPQSTKLVKISWIGENDFKKERTFRFIADELDVELNPEAEKKSGIKILMRYEGALYVSPIRAKDGDIVLEKVKMDKDAEGKERLSLLLYNQGEIHKLVKDLELFLVDEKGESQSLEVDPKEFKKIEGSNILAGKRRAFFIDLPENFKENKFQIKAKMS